MSDSELQRRRPAAQGCGAEAEEADLPRPTPGAATARVPTSPTWIGYRRADPRLARGGRRVAAGTSPAFAPPRSAPFRGASSFSPSRGIPASSTGGVPPIGSGIGCNDDPGSGLDAGGDITARVSLTPANQPLPHELGFVLAG